MSDLFRSAFSYFSQAVPAPTPPVGKTDHPLVGQNIEVGGHRLKIRSLIAEGGFALVFAAQDTQGNWFALKRQLAADRDAADAIIKEICFLRELTGHPAIIRYVQAAQLNPQESGHGRAEFLMLTELCSGGSVVELLQKKALSTSQVMKIFFAACSAVRHMHSRKPPITHRDIKVENLLFDSSGFVKLCDFGSATTETFTPDDSWSALRRSQLEEELARHTTPMYRAPEILDLYSNYYIGPPQDIWALGCILFYLCYRKHPFEDSAKLRIINAKYVLPEVDTGYNMFHPLIQETLLVDPLRRPEMSDLCERAGALAVAINVDVTKPVENLDLPQLIPTGQASVNATSGQLQREFASHGGELQKAHLPSRSPSAVHKTEHEQSAQQQASAVLGAIKGQGMSWFKNIKDKTTAVAQTVQSTYGGRGPDVVYVTSRLVIAPLADGVPEALAGQAEETMRAHILDQARGQFAIYNLSQRRLRCDYSNRLSETPMPVFESGLAPTLKMVLGICRNMCLYLRQNNRNFIVITGPEAQCLFMAAAILLYSRLVARPLSAMEVICSKRMMPALPPSYHRLLDLITTIISSEPDEIRTMVHNRPIMLDSLLMSPPPMFNRLRNGCRPVVEIYVGGSKLWSTAKDYEELRAFEFPECSTVEVDLDGVPVGGDVQIVVYHARWSKIYNRMQQQFMFSLSFHANFIDPNTHMLELTTGDLDKVPEDESKFRDPFRVGLRMRIGENDRGFTAQDVPAFLTYDRNRISRLTLVSGGEEYDAIATFIGANKQKYRQEFSHQMNDSVKSQKSEQKLEKPMQKSEVREALLPESDGGNFFSTLQWNDGEVREASEFPSSRTPSRSPVVERRLAEPSVPKTSLQQEKFSSLLAKRKMDEAEICERMAGIRVTKALEEEDPDADKYKFDCEKELKKETMQTVDRHLQASSDADLLGLGSEISPASFAPSSSVQKEADAALLASFVDFDTHSLNAFCTVQPALCAHKCASSATLTINDANVDDLLSLGSIAKPNFVNRIGLSVPSGSLHRNVSAPSFATPNSSSPAHVFDPFADFLASSAAVSEQKPSQSSVSRADNKKIINGNTVHSGRATPNVQRPNYSRSHFDAISSIGGVKPKVMDNAFDDLLTSQGFPSSSKNVKSIGEMKREEEIKDMDPIAVKIRDWTKGKEANIRALLGSLNDVLWEDAEKWAQPSMAELLTPAQVKRYYRKACLVIHPDKQVGTENEALARAIFTELNDAWTAFEAAGSPSV